MAEGIFRTAFTLLKHQVGILEIFSLHTFLKKAIKLRLICFQSKHDQAGIIKKIDLHYENMHIQIYLKFYHQKHKNFQIKKSDIFHIFYQNIDCGYSF